MGIPASPETPFQSKLSHSKGLASLPQKPSRPGQCPNAAVKAQRCSMVIRGVSRASKAACTSSPEHSEVTGDTHSFPLWPHFPALGTCSRQLINSPFTDSSSGLPMLQQLLSYWRFLLPLRHQHSRCDPEVQHPQDLLLT